MDGLWPIKQLQQGPCGRLEAGLWGGERRDEDSGVGVVRGEMKTGCGVVRGEMQKVVWGW